MLAATHLSSTGGLIMHQLSGQRIPLQVVSVNRVDPTRQHPTLPRCGQRLFRGEWLPLSWRSPHAIATGAGADRSGAPITWSFIWSGGGDNPLPD